MRYSLLSPSSLAGNEEGDEAFPETWAEFQEWAKERHPEVYASLETREPARPGLTRGELVVGALSGSVAFLLQPISERATEVKQRVEQLPENVSKQWAYLKEAPIIEKPWAALRVTQEVVSPAVPVLDGVMDITGVPFGRAFVTAVLETPKIKEPFDAAVREIHKTRRTVPSMASLPVRAAWSAARTEFGREVSIEAAGWLGRQFAEPATEYFYKLTKDPALAITGGVGVALAPPVVTERILAPSKQQAEEIVKAVQESPKASKEQKVAAKVTGDLIATGQIKTPEMALETLKLAEKVATKETLKADALELALEKASDLVPTLTKGAGESMRRIIDGLVQSGVESLDTLVSQAVSKWFWSPEAVAARQGTTVEDVMQRTSPTSTRASGEIISRPNIVTAVKQSITKRLLKYGKQLPGERWAWIGPTGTEYEVEVLSKPPATTPKGGGWVQLQAGGPVYVLRPNGAYAKTEPTPSTITEEVVKKAIAKAEPEKEIEPSETECLPSGLVDIEVAALKEHLLEAYRRGRKITAIQWGQPPYVYLVRYVGESVPMRQLPKDCPFFYLLPGEKGPTYVMYPPASCKG